MACVKCHRSVYGEEHYIAANLGPELLYVAEQDLAQEIDDDDALCMACFDYMTNLLDSTQNSTEVTKKKLVKKNPFSEICITNVCAWCLQLLSKTKTKCLKKGPQREAISIIIAPRQIPRRARVCHDCWSRACKLVGVSASQSGHSQNRGQRKHPPSRKRSQVSSAPESDVIVLEIAPQQEGRESSDEGGRDSYDEEGRESADEGERKSAGEGGRESADEGGRESTEEGERVSPEDEASVAADFIFVDPANNESLSFDESMESPLSAKRRRLRTPQQTATSEGRGGAALPAGGRGSPGAPAAGREQSPAPSTSRQPPEQDRESTPSPSLLDTTCGSDLGTLLGQTGIGFATTYGSEDETDCEDLGDPAPAGRLGSPGAQSPAPPAARAPPRDQRPERTPSPSLLDTTGGSDGIGFATTYGSEDDTDCEDLGDGDVVMPAMHVARSHRVFLDDLQEEQPPGQAEAGPPSPPPSPSLLPALHDVIPQYSPAFFEFNWRPLPRPPVDPAERREVFSETSCGPTAPCPTPYDAFVAIWSPDFMEYIAAETNRYAQELAETLIREGSLGPGSRIARWQDTTADELYVYFAMILATGMCLKFDLESYWSKGELLDTPNFAHIMPIRRFQILSRCLHFNQNSADITKLSPHKAKLYKIQPVLDHLNSRFQSLYVLGRNVALDESLTQWRGMLNINQFIRHKAASVGIKTYEVCEAQTGYLWRFKVHAGREPAAEREETPASAAIPALVVELLRGLEHKGRTVWMDNYYNSPVLARVLKALGFDCAGTLRTNRQCVPSHLASLTKQQMAAGQVASATSGDVDVVVWRDYNRVAMLSTYHGDAVQTVAGRTKPIVAHDYNVCMGGVDKKDQMLSAYPLERKRTRVWYKKLFRRLLNASVLNAFILHRSSDLPDKKRITKHREFRKSLIRDLIVKHKVVDAPAFDLTGKTRVWTRKGSRKAIEVPLLSKKAADHFPLEYGLIPGSFKKERIRRTCVVCKKRVSTHCPACNVALCIPCVRPYHTGFIKQEYI